MPHSDITDLSEYRLKNCKHLWTQGPDTGTDYHYVCGHCGIFGFRPNDLRPWITPFKYQDKAREYVNRMAALEEDWGTIWEGEDPPDNPAWEELAEMAEDWVEPEPEKDR